MDLDRSNIWPGKLGGSGTEAEIIVDGEDERLEVKVGQQPEAQETLAEKGTQPTRWGVWPGTVQVTFEREFLVDFEGCTKNRFMKNASPTPRYGFAALTFCRCLFCIPCM